MNMKIVTTSVGLQSNLKPMYTFQVPMMIAIGKNAPASDRYHRHVVSVVPNVESICLVLWCKTWQHLSFATKASDDILQKIVIKYCNCKSVINMLLELFLQPNDTATAGKR